MSIQITTLTFSPVCSLQREISPVVVGLAVTERNVRFYFHTKDKLTNKIKFLLFYNKLIALSYCRPLGWTTAQAWVDVTERHRWSDSRRGHWAALHQSGLPLKELASLLDPASAARPANRTAIKPSPLVRTTVWYDLTLCTAPASTQRGCYPLSSFHWCRKGGLIGAWGESVGWQRGEDILGGVKGARRGGTGGVSWVSVDGKGRLWSLFMICVWCDDCFRPGKWGIGGGGLFWHEGMVPEWKGCVCFTTMRNIELSLNLYRGYKSCFVLVQFGFWSFRHSKTRFGLRDCWMLPDLI